MAHRKDYDIDRILKDWTYEPGEVSAREVTGADGRPLLQMRLEMGLLQMEVGGRPDGTRPDDFDTYYDYLVAEAHREDGDFRLDDRQCFEVDREFVQFYHRRVCWLALREFGRAVTDADHTLALMDFSTTHAPNEGWAVSHEQYRPFVLFHRIQAAALAVLEEEENPEKALAQVDNGLESLRTMLEENDTEEEFEDNELVQRLGELREALLEHYEIQPSLSQQLAAAVANEEYELAARIRDEIRRSRTSREI